MEPITVSVKTAAQMTDVSESTIRDALNKQQLRAHRIGRRILIRVSDLDAWVDSLIRYGSDEDREALGHLPILRLTR